MRTLLAITLTVTTACELVEPPPEPPPLIELDGDISCGDVSFNALSRRGYDVVARLSVGSTGLLVDATFSLGSRTRAFAITDPALRATFATGERVSEPCSDEGTLEVGVVEYTPVAGTVTFTIEPDIDATPECPHGSGTAYVDDLVVELDGEEFELGDIEIRAQRLGWYPDVGC